MKNASLSRRQFLKTGGSLVVSLAIPAAVLDATAQQTQAAKPLAPDQLDTWIAIKADGNVTCFFGKMDMGQGVDVAVAQMVAEELDVDFKRISVVMGDTAFTCNQGGASGSTAIQFGGIALRNAAAEARRVLVEKAAQQWNVSTDRLSVTDGVVSDGTRKVSFGELLGGKHFNVQLEWNKLFGNPLAVKGKAQPKKPSEYKIVGLSVDRSDVPGKVYGTREYATDIRVPGMLHARMIRPPQAGSTIATIDESSIRDIPGARVVREKEFLGVVANTEWDAIRAAQALKVSWTPIKAPFPSMDEIYTHIRRGSVTKREAPVDQGNVEEALKRAHRVIEAEYEWPFQSHSSMGPACAVADIRTSGISTVWTGSQKPHHVQMGTARLCGIPIDRMRAIWVPGPGSYGRNDAGDCAHEAALLSKLTGRPVRLQYMRYEGTGWDPKSPACVFRARAGIDTNGNVIAYDFHAKGFSRQDMVQTEADPAHCLAGMNTGVALKPNLIFGVPSESYGFNAKRLWWETIPPLLDRSSPLRTAHLRDPVGMEIHFASEQFLDEMAYATGTDPVAFRLKHLTQLRHIAAVKVAAARAGWEARTAPRKRLTGDTYSGQGIGFITRNGTIVSVVADVEVNRKTGRVWVKKYTVAHDCGLVVNPHGLELCLEGNLMQATSRLLYEEVQFERDKVTSVDWAGYPICEMQDTPGAVEIAIIDRPEAPPTGAGEATMRCVSSAVANAIYDATGVRFRRAPLTPERIRAGLKV
jgi:CO/xanthine dehydrogenase Mo-binding subunit